jgi:hypothetical protein
LHDQVYLCFTAVPAAARLEFTSEEPVYEEGMEFVAVLT